MGGGGKGAAVEVVDEGAGALVAALALAVHGAHGSLEVLIQRVHGVDEIAGGPGVGFQVQELVGARFLESVQVDGHAVGRDNQGILIDGAVGVGAGGHGRRVDFGLVRIVEHVAQVHQIALVAPVGHQALGAFHDQVGGVFRGDGGVDLVIAVGVG